MGRIIVEKRRKKNEKPSKPSFEKRTDQRGAGDGSGGDCGVFIAP